MVLLCKGLSHLGGSATINSAAIISQIKKEQSCQRKLVKVDSVGSIDQLVNASHQGTISLSNKLVAIVKTPSPVNIFLVKH